VCKSGECGHGGSGLHAFWSVQVMVDFPFMLNANLEYVDNVSTYMHKYRDRKYNFEACNTCEKYGTEQL
jgi:hypothetical protein